MAKIHEIGRLAPEASAEAEDPGGLAFCPEWRDADGRSCILIDGHRSKHHYSRIADGSLTLADALELDRSSFVAHAVLYGEYAATVALSNSGLWRSDHRVNGSWDHSSENVRVLEVVLRDQENERV